MVEGSLGEFLGEVTSELDLECEQDLSKWREWRRYWVEAVG